jgi:hypothetical protein
LDGNPASFFLKLKLNQVSSYSSDFSGWKVLQILLVFEELIQQISQRIGFDF